MGNQYDSATLPLFVYNEQQYQAAFILSDGAKSLRLNQNMITNFEFMDSISVFETIGARGSITINYSEEFLERGADLSESELTELKQQKRAYVRSFFTPPLKPNGAFAEDFQLTDEEIDSTPTLNFEQSNLGNILLRVELYPVDLNGDIIAKQSDDSYKWAYSFLFSINESEENGAIVSDKQVTLQLVEKLIYDLQKNNRFDVAALEGAEALLQELEAAPPALPSFQPQRERLEELEQLVVTPWSNSDKTGNLMKKVLITGLSDQDYNFEELIDIDDGVAYMKLANEPRLTYWEIFKKIFINHQSTERDQTQNNLPLINFIKLEKRRQYEQNVIPFIGEIPFINEQDVGEVGSERYFPRQISVRSLLHFFHEDQIFIQPLDVIERNINEAQGISRDVNELSKTGKYMLETFYLQGDGDCNKDSQKAEVEQRTYGMTHNLPPGPHSVLFRYKHDLGSSIANEFLTEFRCTDRNPNSLITFFTYHINCGLYESLYENIMSCAFRQKGTSELVFKCDAYEGTFENPLIPSSEFQSTRYTEFPIYTNDVWWGNGPQGFPYQYATHSDDGVLSNHISHYEVDDEIHNVGIKGLMQAGKTVQEAFIHGVDTLKFEVEGITLREPGRFIKVERAGTGEDSPKDKRLTGYWFITSVKNRFFNNRYSQHLECVKPYKIS